MKESVGKLCELEVDPLGLEFLCCVWKLESRMELSSGNSNCNQVAVFFSESEVTNSVGSNGDVWLSRVVDSWRGCSFMALSTECRK